MPDKKSKLTPVTPGQPLLDVVTATRINALQEAALEGKSAFAQVNTGPGIIKSTDAGGNITLHTTEGDVARNSRHPFQITLAKGNGWKAFIEHGTVFCQEGVNRARPFFADIHTQASIDAGQNFIEVSDGDIVFMEVQVIFGKSEWLMDAEHETPISIKAEGKLPPDKLPEAPPLEVHCEDDPTISGGQGRSKSKLEDFEGKEGQIFIPIGKIDTGAGIVTTTDGTDRQQDLSSDVWLSPSSPPNKIECSDPEEVDEEDNFDDGDGGGGAAAGGGDDGGGLFDQEPKKLLDISDLGFVDFGKVGKLPLTSAFTADTKGDCVKLSWENRELKIQQRVLFVKTTGGKRVGKGGVSRVISWEKTKSDSVEVAKCNGPGAGDAVTTPGGGTVTAKVVVEDDGDGPKTKLDGVELKLDKPPQTNGKPLVGKVPLDVDSPWPRVPYVDSDALDQEGFYTESNKPANPEVGDLLLMDNGKWYKWIPRLEKPNGGFTPEQWSEVEGPPTNPASKSYERKAGKDGDASWSETKKPPTDLKAPLGSVPYKTKPTITVTPHFEGTGPPDASLGFRGAIYEDEHGNIWKKEPLDPTNEFAPAEWNIMTLDAIKGIMTPALTADFSSQVIESVGDEPVLSGRLSPGGVGDYIHHTDPDTEEVTWYKKKESDDGYGEFIVSDAPPWLAEDAPVDSVAGKTGVVTLDGDDITETIDHNWLTDAEQTAIAANTADRHTNNANRAILDGIIDSGSGSSWLDDSGAYTSPPSAPVDSVAGKTGTVTLDADDITETVDHNWLTDAEQTAIATNTMDRHMHTNKALLDGLLDSGSGDAYLGNDGVYSNPDYPVDSVAGKTGVVTLDGDDITETVDHNWLTDAEQTAIAANTTDRHTNNANRAILDGIIATGTASTWLNDSGGYTAPPSAPVDSVAGKTGVVTLDADDITETVDHNWLTDAEQTAIAANTTDRHTNNANRAILDGIIDTGSASTWLDDSGAYSAPPAAHTHTNKTLLDGIIDTGSASTWLDDTGAYSAPPAAHTHANKAILDGIIDTGTGSKWYDDSGAYTEPPSAPVDSVAGKTGVVTLDGDDITETVDHNWLTDAEQTAIAANTTDRHTDNANRAVLDGIIATGTASTWLNDSGGYTAPPSAPVDSVAGKTGVVTLDADDITETVDHNWLTDAEQTAIATNTMDRHMHTNKALLDGLIDSGSGDAYLGNDGVYSNPDYPVDSVAGKTGVVTLDGDDITETVDHNWLTDAEQTAIAANTTDRHTNNANRAILDGIIATGTASTWLNDSGGYTAPDADDITETVDHNWLTDAEQTAIAANTTDRHTDNANRAILDGIIATGTGSLWYDDSGNYSEPPSPHYKNWSASSYDYTEGEMVRVDGVIYIVELGHTSSMTTKPGAGASWATYWDRVVHDLDADDITETVDHNWLTDAEQTAIAANTADRHTDNANRAVLDTITQADLDEVGNLISNGSGSTYKKDDGTYGSVSADHVSQTASNKFVTQSQLTDIAANTADRHTDNANRAVLDTITQGDLDEVGNLISNGSGSTWKNDSGGYSAPPDTLYDIAFSPTSGAFDLRENGSTITTIFIPQYNIAYSPASGAFDFRKDGVTIKSIVIPDENTKYTVTWDNGTRNLTVDPSDAVPYNLNIPFGDANDIAETTSRKFITQADLDEVGNLISNGSGSTYKKDDGTYGSVSADHVSQTASRKFVTQSQLTDIADNTTARHTDNVNRTILDTITQADLDDIADNTTARHTDNVNRTILDTITQGDLNEVGNLISNGSGSTYKKDDGTYGGVSADHVSQTASRKFVTQSQLTDIGEIPLWWPKTSPGDGTYTGFTISGGSVTFNT
jgi:Ni,Fe-hydrogenase I large subunit